MKNYIVFGDGCLVDELESWAIVKANSSDEAISKYIMEIGIKQDDFLEELGDTALNGPWYRIVDPKCILTYELEVMEENELEKQVINNIKEFFGEHKDWANEYMEFYKISFDLDAPPAFSTSMMCYMATKSNWFGLKTMKLNQVTAILE